MKVNNHIAATAIRARIGMVNFINTAPLYEMWQRTVHRPEWLVVEGPPTVLNSMLFNDALDLGFVSSHEYAANPHAYKILSDLSISSDGAVGSVFLFSKTNPEDLSGRLVLLSAQSQTSVSLVKIILKEFYGVTPRYASAKLHEKYDGEEPEAVLAIGDEALKLYHGKTFPWVIDLGDVWKNETGLPFVFAVWAVRENFCRKDPDCVVEIHQELLRCVNEGKANLAEISRKVAARIPMPPDECFAYLRGIEYDLSPRKQDALELFIKYLVKRGEAAADALPLKICG